MKFVKILFALLLVGSSTLVADLGVMVQPGLLNKLEVDRLFELVDHLQEISACSEIAIEGMCKEKNDWFKDNNVGVLIGWSDVICFDSSECKIQKIFDDCLPEESFSNFIILNPYIYGFDQNLMIQFKNINIDLRPWKIEDDSAEKERNVFFDLEDMETGVISDSELDW